MCLYSKQVIPKLLKEFCVIRESILKVACLSIHNVGLKSVCFIMQLGLQGALTNTLCGSHYNVLYQLGCSHKCFSATRSKHFFKLTDLSDLPLCLAALD